MKSFIITFFYTIFLCVPIAACGHPDMYVHGFAGANYLVVRESSDMDVTTEPGYLLGIGVGLVRRQVRIEFEGTYRHNEYKGNVPVGPGIFFSHGHLNKITSFVNVFYDFPADFFIDYLTPYIGIGAGHKFDVETINIKIFPYAGKAWEETSIYKANGFSGQLILGLGLPMSLNTVTKMEYRFLKDDKDFANHSFVVNLDRRF